MYMFLFTSAVESPPMEQLIENFQRRDSNALRMSIPCSDFPSDSERLFTRHLSAGCLPEELFTMRKSDDLSSLSRSCSEQMTMNFKMGMRQF